MSVTQDMQSSTTILDFLKKLLETWESSGQALEAIVGKGGSSIDTALRMFKDQERTLRDFVSHIEGGKEVFTIEVSDPIQAEELKTRLANNQVPFIATQTKSGIMFMYKDIDEDRFMNIANEVSQYMQNKGHEMEYDAFLDRCKSNGVGFSKIEGLSVEEIAVFRREAEKESSPFTFAIHQSRNGKFDIYASSKDELERTVIDSLFVMGTKEGQKYARDLAMFDKAQNDFMKKLQDVGQGKSPSYLVDLNNPTKILELSNGNYKMHGFSLKNGKVIDTVSSFPRDITKDIYRDLKGWSNPVLISSAQATSFIKGRSKDGRIELDSRYTGTPERFLALSDHLTKEYGSNSSKTPKVPLQEPTLNNFSLVKDFNDRVHSMTIYQNLPLAAFLKIEKADIDGVYTYNKGNVREVACTPAAAAEVSKLLKDSLARDKGPLETWLTMEKYKGHGERGDDKTSTFYIVDAAAPDAFLEISPQDATYKDKKQTVEITAPAGHTRDESILSFVSMMGAPVILSDEEFEITRMDVERREHLCEIYFTKPDSTNVIRAKQESLAQERETLSEIINSPDKAFGMERDRTPAQSYVLSQMSTRKLSAQEQKPEKEYETSMDLKRKDNKAYEHER